MKRILLLLLACASWMYAETIVLDSSTDPTIFDRPASHPTIDWRTPPTMKDGIGRISGGFLFFSKEFTVDPKKKYHLSGEFRILGATLPVTQFLFGFNPADEEGMTIFVYQTLCVEGYALAQLQVPALEGDTEIIINDVGWKKPAGHFNLGFDAQEDGSDLPNRSTSPRLVQDGIRHLSNGNVAVQLTRPLQGSFPAFTFVRMMADGPTYQYVGKGPQPGKDWVKWEGEIQGIHKPGAIGPQHWYYGTRKARIVLRCFQQGLENSTLEFRNVKVVSEP